MALTPEQAAQVALLKTYAGDAVGTLTDDQLYELIAAQGNVQLAAGSLWSSYAAKHANLIDVSEGSSSRKLSNIYSQALKMADHFQELGSPSVDDPSIGRTRSVRITR